MFYIPRTKIPANWLPCTSNESLCYRTQQRSTTGSIGHYCLIHCRELDLPTVSSSFYWPFVLLQLCPFWLLPVFSARHCALSLLPIGRPGLSDTSLADSYLDVVVVRDVQRQSQWLERIPLGVNTPRVFFSRGSRPLHFKALQPPCLVGHAVGSPFGYPLVIRTKRRISRSGSTFLTK